MSRVKKKILCATEQGFLIGWKAMKLAFGYNTNGFAHHRLEDALSILAECGYDGVALTLDVYHFNPFTVTKRDVADLRRRLKRLSLRCVVETGARFVLDPRRKHQPTLLSNTLSGRKTRESFLCRAVEIAAELDAEAVSFWSGAKPADTPDEKAWERLVEGCQRVCAFAAKRGVTMAFEPEPGMFVQSLAECQRLIKEVSALKLTLDVGHVFCSEAEPFEDLFAQYAPLIRNMHIEDIRGRRHQHLMFGEGEVDFRPVLAAIRRSGYAGLIHVELSRDSHRAPEVAARSLQFLRQIETTL